MNHIRNHWKFVLIFIVLIMMPVTNVPAKPLSSTTITLLGPQTCPVGGCSAGQRLNLRATYDLGVYDATLSPNIRVCVYTPTLWAANGFSMGVTGSVTGAPYTSITDPLQCSPAPTNYQLLGGAQTTMMDAEFGDALDFVFRLGPTATSNGSVLLRVLEEQSADNWQQTQQAFISIPVTAASTQTFVARDAATCATNSPCLINSNDDLPLGLGTGLKDAVDLLPIGGTVTILGNYPVKSQAVQINKAITIQGLLNAAITYEGSLCTLPLLSLESGVTLQNLHINDGTCTTISRDLIHINSLQNVNILYNTLQSGKDALYIFSNNANVNVRFNHIQNNSGYAAFGQAGIGTGQFTLIANNLANNRSGETVVCANFNTVDHNYWGAGQIPSVAAPTCTFQTGKHLGSPIQLRNNQPGVDAQQVSVTDQKTYYFENKLGVQHPTGEVDFSLMLINHGNLASNAPFQTGTNHTLVPCSNYYDIFLAPLSIPGGSLSLFFKYNHNAACIANVESSTYCGSTNPAVYPLWWYDPNQLITSGWDTTGQNPAGSGANGATGQTTTCLLDNDEISVQIDSTGRPGMQNDLNYTPFVVGLVGQPAATILSAWTAQAGNQQVTLHWQTSSELNTSGFYVQRRQAGSTEFSRVSPFLPRTGTDTSGSTYQFLDSTNLMNLITYEYRLEIVGNDLLSVYSAIISATPVQPSVTPTVTSTITTTLTSTVTLTPTITVSPTITLSPTITQTPTISLTPTITTSGTTTTTTTITPTTTTSGTITTTITITVTRTPTRTRTTAPTATRTRYRTPTRAPTVYRTPYRSPTRTLTPATTRTPRITASPMITGPALTLGSGSGYPAPTTDGTLLPPTNGNEGTPGGYPPQTGLQPTQDLTTTLQPQKTNSTDVTPTITSIFTSFFPRQTQIASGETPTTEPTNSKTWVYTILGGFIGLSILLIVAFFLWKKGILPLPF